MSKKSWLCRDLNGVYVICPLAKQPEYISHSWYQSDGDEVRRQIDICTHTFEREFPNIKGKLKPGDGPIRIELTLRFCDE